MRFWGKTIAVTTQSELDDINENNREFSQNGTEKTDFPFFFRFA